MTWHEFGFVVVLDKFNREKNFYPQTVCILKTLFPFHHRSGKMTVEGCPAKS